MRRALRWAALAVSGLLLGNAPSLAADPLTAQHVFVSLARKTTDRARAEYLKAKAGCPIRGVGHLEALTPRTYYDTSVPDSDPMVAVLKIDQGRVAACGLPRSVMDSLGWLREGSPVVFEGRLVDAQGWDGTATLYLTRCSISRR